MWKHIEDKRAYERKYRKSPERRAHAKRYWREYRKKYDKLERVKKRIRAHANLKYKLRPDVRKKNYARTLARKYIPAIECLLCGSKEKLERHHEDYTKPLEVIIVCRRCHLKLEGKEMG